MDVNTKIIRFIDKNDLISAQTFLNLLDTDEISNLELENSLYYASKVGKASFVNLLLEFSIDPLVFQESEKGAGLTPIHIATMKNHLEVVQSLLLHSYELIECETDEHHHNTTPINLAAELKTCEILDFYLESGADVNKKDARGQFPLWKTVRNGHYQNTLNILEKGGPIVDLQDNSGITPLHAACTSGQNQMTKLLLKYNADPNMKDKSGDTALHHAAQIQVQRLIFHYNLSLTQAHLEVFYTLIVWSNVDMTLRNDDGDLALDIIEIPAADLFDLLFKHKKWLREKKVENFQSLFQLSEAFNQIETSQRKSDVSELFAGIDKYASYGEEESAKQSGGPCVLISSTKIPYKRKFLHLFKDGKLINPGASEREQSKCPMGFGNSNNNNNSNAGEKAKCPFGHGSETFTPLGEALSSKEDSEMDVCPITGRSGPNPHKNPPTKDVNSSQSRKEGVCPITGRSGPIPEGHSSVTQPKDVKPADTNYKTQILPTTCPFSPDYVSKENDGETLPECSQQ